TPEVAFLGIRPLIGGVGALSGEPGEVPEARFLDLLHRAADLAVFEEVIPGEFDLANPNALAVIDDEGDLHATSAPDGLRLVLHLSKGSPFVLEHVLDHGIDPSCLGLVEERVETQGDLALLELVLDVLRGQGLASPEIDDLDPLALLVEEARLPESPEVLPEPGLVEAVARLCRDVVEEGVLGDETVLEDPHLRNDVRPDGCARCAHGVDGSACVLSRSGRRYLLPAGPSGRGSQEQAQRGPRGRRSTSDLARLGAPIFPDP